MNNDMYDYEISQEELDAWEKELYQDTMSEIEKTEKVIPEKEMKPVKDAAMDMAAKTTEYRRLEQDCGHSQPEVWVERTNGQLKVTKDLAICRKAYEDEAAQEIKQMALQKAKESIDDVNKTFREHIKKMRELYANELENTRRENQRMQAQMKEMQSMINELIETSRERARQPLLNTMALAFSDLQQTVKTNGEHYSKVVRDGVSHKVQDTYHAISEAPRRIKNAIKAKAWNKVESVLAQTTHRLKEASQHMEQNRLAAEQKEKTALEKAKATPAKWRQQAKEQEPEQKVRPQRRVTVMRKQENTQSRGMER